MDEPPPRDGDNPRDDGTRADRLVPTDTDEGRRIGAFCPPERDDGTPRDAFEVREARKGDSAV